MGQLNVVLVHHHTFAWGPSHALAEFLARNARELSFLEFPFSHRRLEASCLRKFRNGNLIKVVPIETPLLPEFLLYLWHFYKTVFTYLRLHKRYDLFIGVDCLNAFAGLVLKRLGLVLKVVFYVIDFVPHRFSNPIINALYHGITRVVLRQADVLWNMSKRMEMTWVKKFGVDQEKNILVPTGFFQHEISEIDTSNKQRSLLVLAGSLSPSKGIDLVIEALKDVVTFLPNVKLMVVGGGPYEKNVRNMVQELGLSRHVDMLGYIPEHKKMLQLISRGSIGLALYPPDPNGLAWYGDPGRIKEYFALGLPVITTNVPEIAFVINEAKAGIVIPYDKNKLVDAILVLMTDDGLFSEMSKNALELSKKFEYNGLFASALRHTISSSNR